MSRREKKKESGSETLSKQINTVSLFSTFSAVLLQREIFYFLLLSLNTYMGHTFKLGLFYEIFMKHKVFYNSKKEQLIYIDVFIKNLNNKTKKHNEVKTNINV